jgi:hypothetical protein
MADGAKLDQAPPAPPIVDEPSGEGSGGWTRLCSVGDRYEAEMIRGVLEGENLGPVIIETIQMPGSWLLPSGHERQPQNIYVMRAVLEAAKLALLEAGLDYEPGDAISSEGRDQRWRQATKLIRWAVITAVAGVFVSYLVHLMQGRAGLPG